MTRETKIGLLVGLAFIIVVGILLSDHMSSAIEPASAPLQVAGSNLRSGLGQPGGDDDASSNAPLAADTARITPQQPVPTQEELSPQPKPVTVPVPAPVAADPPITLLGQNPGAAASHPPVALTQAARDGGEELVDTNLHPLAADPEATAPQTTLRSYKAQPGDSLSKMASRLLGSNSKANRDLIVAANRTLAADPNKVIVGHTYSIPVLGKTAARPQVQAAAQPASSPLNTVDDTDTASPAPAAARPTATGPEYVYTVKPGDTLWKIAVDELGDADTVPAIEELNADVLKGAARIHPKMKLRLPAKPVADAN